MALDLQAIKHDFPPLSREIDGKLPVYLDNACVTLRPDSVIEGMAQYYREFPGCHGRSLHYFGERTSREYSLSREALRRFVNAKSPQEIVFTRNATEGINLLSQIIPLKGKTVLISELEHNSNLLPWQKLKKEQGVEYEVFALNPDLTFSFDKFKEKLGKNVGLVALTHVSNVSGATHPIEEISRLTCDNGSLLLVDGAQAVSSIRVDVQKLGVDFYLFSAHKMLGPSGIGCLYGKKELLESYPPFLVGGETVLDSNFDSYTLAGLPDKYEAGIQNYAAAIGFRKAVEYLERIGEKAIKEHLVSLNTIVSQGLSDEKGIVLIGPKDPAERGGIFNFYIPGVDPFLVVDILHRTKRIMVRCGKHCAHSWYNKGKTPDSIRASFYIYNTPEEAEEFVREIKTILKHYKK